MVSRDARTLKMRQHDLAASVMGFSHGIWIFPKLHGCRIPIEQQDRQQISITHHRVERHITPHVGARAEAMEAGG